MIQTMFNKNTISTSAYIIESFDMWYTRLGHVNIHSLKTLIKMNLLLNLDKFSFNKCEICVEVKHFRPTLKSVTNRKFELLELIHIDLAYFKNLKSKEGNTIA